MKKVLMILCALCVGFAYADNVPENKIVSSKEYVDSAIADTQPMLNANNTDLTNNVIVYTDTAGTVTNKPVSATLTNNAALPTVGAVNSGLDTKQDEIGRPIVPNGYTQLEYIESTGTQYIDTGIVENTIDYMEMDFENKTSNGFMFVNGSTQLGVVDSRYGTTEQNKRYKIKQELSNNKWKFTNITNGTVYTQSYNTGTFKLWLFRLNNHGSFASVKIYNFLCSASGVVRCNLVPARRNSDGEVGMYDTVTGTFFINAGTGTFIAGPVVIDATGMVVTYTATPGELDVKGIYQDTGTYADQMDTLIDAGTFNEALRAGLEGEFVCANRPDAYDPITGNCWLWEISSIPILPNGYTQLEYLESTGIQWIDTEVSYGGMDTGTVTMDIKFDTLNYVGVNGYLQLTKSGSCLLINTYPPSVCVSPYVRNVLTYTLDNRLSKLYVDSTLLSSQQWGSLPAGAYYVFKMSNYSGAGASGRIYSLNMIKNSELVRNMIPARRNSDDTIGMYDTVSNTFFTNSGSGTFVGGPVVNDNKIYLPQNQ